MAGLLRIDLKRFGKNREAALEYLRSRLNEPLKIEGDQVTLANTKPGEAKTLLHKFLHHAQLDRYHVAVINSGLIEIRPVEVKKKQRTRGKGGSDSSPLENRRRSMVAQTTRIRPTRQEKQTTDPETNSRAELAGSRAFTTTIDLQKDGKTLHDC